MSFSSTIPKERILNRLRYENPWWVDGQIQQVYREMSRRLYFDLFFPYVKETEIKRAVVLMGPRRVGKTVMLLHTIEVLLKDGVDSNQLFFVGIDNPIYINLGLEELLDLCKEAVKKEDLKGAYVFFDEIQYLKDWQRHLKVLVDSYPDTKFIVSGSAAAALSYGSSESGAGRFTDFMLPPLTFQEYIHLKDLNHLVYQDQLQYGNTQIPYWFAKDLRAFNREFVNYLNYGGYPEVVLSEKIRSDIGRYVKSDIIDKVLLRDLPSLYGIRDVQELNRFFVYVAYNTGNEFSYTKMAKESGISKNTIKKYLEYLEATFLIKVLNKVDINAKHFKRVTSFKIYLTNPSLRSALFSPVEETDDEMGNMVETGIFSQWLHRDNLELNYARWGSGGSHREVDLVLLDEKNFKPIWGVEIKWSNRFFKSPKKLKSLIEFCEKNHFKSALVTSIDQSGIKDVNDLSFTFIPASTYAYNIGNNTLQKKNNRTTI